MQRQDNQGSRNYCELEAAFFLPKPGDLAFSGVRQLVQTVTMPFREITAAFLNNIEAALWIAALPEFIARSGATALVRQQVFFRERLLARARTLRARVAQMDAHPGEPAPASSDDCEDTEEIRCNVDRTMLDQGPLIEDHTKATLHSLLLGDEGLASAPVELLRQSTVLCWSALEVLANDVFVSLLNTLPKLALALFRDEAAKRLFDARAFSLETLAEHTFDLSKAMGDVILSKAPIDSVPRMKAAYCALFPAAASLRIELDAPELWELSQKDTLLCIGEQLSTHDMLR